MLIKKTSHLHHLHHPYLTKVPAAIPVVKSPVSKTIAGLEVDQPWDLAFCHHIKLRVEDCLWDVDHVLMNVYRKDMAMANLLVLLS